MIGILVRAGLIWGVTVTPIQAGAVVPEKDDRDSHPYKNRVPGER